MSKRLFTAGMVLMTDASHIRLAMGGGRFRWDHAGWIIGLALLSCETNETAAIYDIHPRAYAAWATQQTTATALLRIPVDRFAEAPLLQRALLTVVFSAEAFDAVSRDRAGRFYVWEKSADRVLVLEPTGELRATVDNLSGIADGLRHTFQVVGSNDTLYVVTLEPAPVVYYISREGIVTRRVELPWQTGGGVANATYLHHTNSGIVAAQRVLLHKCQSPQRMCVDSVRIVALELDGDPPVRDLLSFPSAASYELEGGYRYVPPYSPYAEYAVGSTGDIYTHGGDAYDIAVWSSDGRFMGRILGDTVRVQVPDEARKEHLLREISDFRRRFPNRSKDPWLRGREREVPRLPVTQYAAVIGRMIVSNAGTLLVERPSVFEASASVTKWDVIDRTGNLLGQAATPTEMSPFAFEWPHIYVRFAKDGQTHVGRIELR
jgi:hypothetical protein